jgi:hypothetical protein
MGHPAATRAAEHALLLSHTFTAAVRVAGVGRRRGTDKSVSFRSRGMLFRSIPRLVSLLVRGGMAGVNTCPALKCRSLDFARDDLRRGYS